MKDRLHDAAMAECYRADPVYATALLVEVWRDGDLAERAILLRQLQWPFFEVFDVTKAARSELESACDRNVGMEENFIGVRMGFFRRIVATLTRGRT